MNLKRSKFLYLDCQTTGMRPPAGHLLEFAWAYGSTEDEPMPVSHLIQLPADHELPRKISEITGIEPEHMAEAHALEEVFAKFQAAIQAMPEPKMAIIHYAQFEKPYLADLFARFAQLNEIPFTILCSHQMCKRLLPNLPSQNIRGAAGFFGLAPNGLKRAAHHVEATHRIWRGLVDEAAKHGLEDLQSLQDWLAKTPSQKVTRYEYRLDKIKRLELPDCPGIYRMISKSGEVLYVGKATSLKSRVNSYFRGKKDRDRRKLEMLAQVYDLRTTSCATPLEAAIMESDEIKRLNPPYNVVLKRGRRHLMFYNRDFSRASATQSAEFSQGPFRNMNWIEHLRLLFASLQQDEFEQIFFLPVPPDLLREGFELFCALQGLELGKIKSVRSLLAKGMQLLRDYVEPETEEEVDIESDVDEEPELDLPPTPEELAGKYERLLRRAAAEYRRGKELTQLLDSQITLQTKAGPRELRFGHGQLGGEPKSLPFKWADLSVDDFDRMSILMSELSKYEFTLSRRDGKSN